MPANCTISDVAKKAGVDRCTVSRVLNGRAAEGRISDTTAQRVRRAADQLRYTPHFAARALRTSRTWNIGYLLSDQIVPGVSSVNMTGMRLVTIEAACAARGYSVQMMRFDPVRAENAVARIASRCFDGLVFTAMEEPHVIDLCRRMQLPCVDTAGTMGKSPVCAVEADVIGVRLEALRHLAQLGHRRIGLAILNRERHRRYFAALEACAAADPALAGCRLTRMDLPSTVESGNGDAGLLMAMWRATPAEHRPTAILAYEHTTIGFLAELKSHGLSCPRDVSLIAMTRTPLVETAAPGVTAIDTVPEEVQRLGVNLLVDAIEAGRRLTRADSPPMMACRIVLRDSCAVPSPYRTTHS